MSAGERLATLAGPTAVLGIQPQHTPQTVYNLEVQGQHVFRVTSNGLLVHNMCAPNSTGLKLTREAGWNARDFSRKARALQDLAERGKLGKASGTAAMRTGATGQYKNQLIRRAYDTYDKATADRLAARIRSMHADHIQDLQLSGLDEASNLWLLDADVNVGLGRQIWQQIKDLPDGTIINSIEILGL